MKILLTIITASVLLFSNSTDVSKPGSLNPSTITTECVREQWLTIYKKNDSYLFHPSQDTIDIYEEIKQLLLDGQIRLWHKRRDNSEWLTSPLPSSIQYSKDSPYHNIYFDYLSEGDSPIQTVLGKDSLDENNTFVYPMTKYEPVTFDKISEIRIKEILVHDTTRNIDYLKPSLIAFDVYTIRHNILFWVKVDDLIENIKINRNWIDYVANKKYEGFVYKRNSCDDPDYEWKKVFH
ncbi:hypothetical protein [Brumimicrobium mesophilum]|uniref:hypothetical protein n=1 Tax=Brumimicrobium mesophilum TaxID=392717 RepID=UPI000D141CCD|nr:hypothetical protein [Brumimicrobium mesophilum]